MRRLFLSLVLLQLYATAGSRAEVGLWHLHGDSAQLSFGPYRPPFASSISDCPKLKRRSKRPTDVHDLRPEDIDIVIAMGDSITAGFGAKGLPVAGEILPMKLTSENRGISYPIGADANAVTLRNMLAHYNTDLEGGSVGDHLAEVGLFCFPYTHYPGDHLNSAQSGAMVQNLLGQLDYVIHKLNHNPDIDFEKDFKLLSVFIGSNDLCSGCSIIANKTFLSPDAYEATMRDLFDSIREAIPRVVVNVQMVFNVSQVYDLTYDSLWCETVRLSGLAYECTCAFLPGEAGDIMRSRMDSLAVAYNERLLRIAEDYKRTYDKNFLLIVDPLFSGVRVSEWPLDSLSDIDCFHPAVSSHEVMAIGAWNNLYMPFERKARTISPSSKHLVFCPTESSRIQ
ncbi:hypothetical protein HK101_007265 [Irineochytrium annulatum]|nr:hypothetical protein HK101_007265 [Irineochytrium annulatum]